MVRRAGVDQQPVDDPERVLDHFGFALHCIATSLRACTVLGETGVDMVQVVLDDAAVHRVHAPRVVRQTGH